MIALTNLLRRIRDAYANFWNSPWPFTKHCKLYQRWICQPSDFAKDVVFTSKELNPRTPSNANSSMISFVRNSWRQFFLTLPEEILILSLSLKQKTSPIVEFRSRNVCQPLLEILDTWSAFMDFQSQAQKLLEEVNEKVIGKSLEAHIKLIQWSGARKTN